MKQVLEVEHGIYPSRVPPVDEFESFKDLFLAVFMLFVFVHNVAVPEIPMAEALVPEIVEKSVKFLGQNGI